MENDVLPRGGVGNDLARQIHQWWIDEAGRAGLDLTGFDQAAPLEERIAWALSRGWDIAGMLARQSTRMQQSIPTQFRENVQFAARNRLYTPPEYACADVVTGRKSDREGLQTMKEILETKKIGTLLVYKLSRLFRSAHKGFAFVQENVVENGLRAVSISQAIDTASKETWKTLTVLHGLSDEMLLTAIADHVRTGLTTLFLQGYVVGAVTVGYAAVEVPGAPPTKLGKPRRMPQVDRDVAKLIVAAFEGVRDSMPIKRAWRQWLASGGPCDRRSRSKVMSYAAFRRLLANPRYTGRWAFGVKRNQWFSKKDYCRQVAAPGPEVKIVHSEELRIVSDGLFFAVQKRLAELTTGPRGPKKRKDLRLWDMVTDCFFCAACSTENNPVRFYQAGANGKGMRCKRGDLCPCLTVVKRQEAIEAVCTKLAELLAENAELIERVVARSGQVDAAGDEAARAELAAAERKLGTLKCKADDLMELAGEGTDVDRERTKAKVRAVRAEATAAQLRISQIKNRLDAGAVVTSPEQIRQSLRDVRELLRAGAAGELGDDIVFRAAAAFRLMVDGQVMVEVQRRPGRTQVNVVGRFRPRLLRPVQDQLGDTRELTEEAAEVRVWLRTPPQKDRLAERVHQLIDFEGQSYRGAAKVLKLEGHNVNSGVVWQIYRRYYEMVGQPVPLQRYNNGRPRKSQGDVRPDGAV